MTARGVKLTTTAEDAPEVQLGRLIDANQRLQHEITERLTLGGDWKADLLFRAMIDQVPDYLFIKDMEGRFVIANQAVATDLGMSPEELVGKTDFDVHTPETASKFRADDLTVLQARAPMIDIEEFLVDSAGNKKWLLTSKVPLRNERDEIIGLIGIARDVTARRKAEEEVHFLAHHDPLTRLPNRSLLMHRLGKAITQAESDARGVAVAFIDLDNFKEINDSMGHHAGDDFLRAAAGRMVNCVRAADTVARLGGDEFVVVLADQPHSPAAVVPIVEKVRAAIAEPIRLDERTLEVTCSIGVATYPGAGLDADILLRNADLAMYQAKAAGRDTLAFFGSGDAHLGHA